MTDATRGNPQTTLHLVVPRLTGPAPGVEPEPPALPALEMVFGRAELARGPTVRSVEHLLFDLFGIEVAPQDDLPVAAVTRVLDLGVIDKGWWIRADPVHLRPEGGHLVLIPPQQLDIQLAEAQRLATEIAEAYAGQGWLLKAPRPGRWYLKPPRAPKIITTPLALVAGHDIHPYLPQGRDGMTWHGLLTEMQILLHTANANTDRERRGAPPINSLWFWGGGRLPKIKASPWTKIWSEEPVGLSLARLSETPTGGVPPSFVDWQRSADPPGRHLVWLEPTQGTSLPDIAEEWVAFMRELESRWIAPAIDALRRNTLTKLELISAAGHHFQLDARQLRRWWRGRRGLQSIR